MLRIINSILFFALISLIFPLSGKGQTFPMTISSVEKVYGLSKIWQEIHHKSTSWNHVTVDEWDSLYKAFVPVVLKSANDYEYYRSLQQFSAHVRDANTWIQFPPEFSDSIVSPPIMIREIRSRYYVINVDKQLADKLPVGSEVTRVNGFDIMDFLQTNVYPFVAAATPQSLASDALDVMLAGWINTRVLLNYQTPDGRTVNELFDRKRPGRIQWARPVFDNRSVTLDWPAREIAVITINRFDADLLKNFPGSKQLSRAETVILDLRNSNSGKIGIAADIAARFTDLPYLVLPGFGIRNYPYNYGGLDHETNLIYYGRMIKDDNYTRYAPDTLFITSCADSAMPALIILAGPGTGGTAEHFLFMIRQSPQRATILGEPTRGCSGESFAVPLPGGGSVMVNSRFDFYPDNELWIIKGIPPDIEVYNDIKSLLNGEDVVMNRALEMARRGN